MEYSACFGHCFGSKARQLMLAYPCSIASLCFPLQHHIQLDLKKDGRYILSDCSINHIFTIGIKNSLSFLLKFTPQPSADPFHYGIFTSLTQQAILFQELMVTSSKSIICLLDLYSSFNPQDLGDMTIIS